MPYSVQKTSKGKYSVKSPHGTKAKGTTKSKAKAQVRFLQGIKHGMVPRGSGPFTSSEIEQGYKTLCNASDLRQMDESVTDMKEVLAKRRLPGHLRRSQSTKGKY